MFLSKIAAIAPKSGGFRAFIAEVVELCSSSDLGSAHEAKKASSSQYRAMVSKFEAPEFKRLLAEASVSRQLIDSYFFSNIAFKSCNFNGIHLLH